MDLVVVMDGVDTIRPAGDTSFALMLAGQERGHRVFHCTPPDVGLVDGEVGATVRPATMVDRTEDPVLLGEPGWRRLAEVDVVLIRTDPPFDRAYLLVTLLLELTRGSCLVVNDPRGLREANEKLYGCRFPDLMPPTIVSADRSRLAAFARRHGRAVLKPLDGHGGRAVHVLAPGDLNERPILEGLTGGGRRPVMAQAFLEGVFGGDRRILLLDGEPLGAVLRVPVDGDFRANLGLGARASAVELDGADRRIVATLAPALRADGLTLVGIDVIDGRLIEVNVTSPTGIRQLAALSGGRPDVAVIEWLERRRREIG